MSVVVPCYNEAGNLGQLHARLTAACTGTVAQSYEIVLVNDGSTDATRQLMFALAADDAHVTAIDLARNYGHQIALSAGLEFCRGRRVMILDADLQDPPELLGEFMAKMDEGYDVVFGQRRSRDGEKPFKLASAALFYRLLRKSVDIDIPADSGDFRLMTRRAVDHLNAMPERFRFIRGMVSWIGLRQTALVYDRHRRYSGTSHYPLRKMVALAVDAVTSFSIAPLRFASHLGLVFGLLGFATLVYTLASWAAGSTVPGWTSLAAITLILGSSQMLMLGIFGEYLGRMYMETKRRPLYIVNEIVANRQAGAAARPGIHELQDRLQEVANG